MFTMTIDRQFKYWMLTPPKGGLAFPALVGDCRLNGVSDPDTPRLLGGEDR